MVVHALIHSRPAPGSECSLRGIARGTCALLERSGHYDGTFSARLSNVCFRFRTRGLPDFLLRPFQIPLHVFGSFHALGEIRAGLRQTCSCLCLQSEEFAVFGVELAGPADCQFVILEDCGGFTYICACFARL